MSPCIPCNVALLYARGLLPRRVAHSLFCRSALRSSCYEDRVITRDVDFGSSVLRLELPLRFKQNWTLLFEDFNSDADGQALRLFRHYARRAEFVFDVGMNAGLYLYHAAAVRSGEAKVFGFEPNRDLADTVRRNIASNALSGVRVVNKCLSAKDGVAELFLTNTEHMSSLSRDFITNRGRPVLKSMEVGVTSLDSFVAENSIGADLLKIDVEGLEPDVIAGAWRTIEHYKPAILMEIADNNLKLTFVRDLFLLGYRCLYLAGKQTVEVASAEEMVRKRRPGYENYLFAFEPISDIARVA